MRILQVGKYYHPHPGGIEQYLRLLCEQLAPHVDLDVLVANDSPRTVHETVGGVRVTRCATHATVASTPISPRMLLELATRRYDIAHLHLPHPVAVASYLAAPKPTGHKLVVTYHSDVVKQRALMALYAPLVDAILRRADAVLATSPNYVESSSVLRRFRDKVRIVPCAVAPRRHAPTAELRALADTLRARYRRPLRVGVGRLVYYKGFDVAIRAMVDIEADLVLVGEGPLRAELEALARRLAVADRVHFAGRVDDATLVAYFHAADLFVLPSVARSEAFGIVQLEAMASGKPVINTDLDSGVPYVSLHEQTGLTVPPGDVAALGEAIRALLADPARRARLGEAGKARVDAEFTTTTQRDRVMALYAELLGTPP